jgi:DNA (cytosine-5)-methyltransferase 1
MNATRSLLTSVDLFAGVGGIRLGFEYAFNRCQDSRIEMRTSFVCEKDGYARATYSQNFKTEPGDWGFDICSEQVKKSIPPFDICLAGFPCQAFSNAGHRKGFEDEKKRGTLFFDVRDICKQRRPKIIFCENVKGLFHLGKRGENGYHEIYGQIREELVKLGYVVREAILNSADFGVPQNRERLYIVAIRKDIEAAAAVRNVRFAFPKNNEHAHVSRQWAASCLQDIREQGPIQSKYYLSERYLETLKRHRRKHEAKRHGFGFVVREWGELSGTILCSNMGRERNLVVDPDHETPFLPPRNVKGPLNTEYIRRLTPREFMRLQGFPPNFRIEGVTDTQLYKQFGNSVTVPVIEAIAREIRLVLEAAEF